LIIFSPRRLFVLISLLVRLVGEAEEVIPGQLLNLSASGASIFVDERFSLLLPPPPRIRFEAEVFFAHVGLRRVLIEVRWVERRGVYHCALGCRFVNLPTAARLALRGEIGARLAGEPLVTRHIPHR
jgi:hypothetical protein